MKIKSLNFYKPNLFLFIFFIFANVSAAISSVEIENSFKNVLKNKSFLNINDQSFCIQDLNSAKNESELKVETTGLNISKQVIPASVSKIFITEMMLVKYSPNYRFITGAKISKNILYIYGGFDPFFESKDFFQLLNQITTNKKKVKINRIMFDKSFYINNSANSLDTKKNIQKVIKEYKKINNIFLSDLEILENQNLKSDKTGYVIASDLLIDEISKMNFYSNNNAAETMFDFLGGEDAFLKYIEKNYKQKGNTYFTNGSGLNFNTTTCEHTLNSLKNLHRLSLEKNFDLKKVLSVPGGDIGAMRNLDMNIPKNKNILAKNGYLDGNNTISGIVLEENKKPIYFGLFLTYKDANKYKTGIETVKEFLNLMVK